jgi:hypothetical protein
MIFSEADAAIRSFFNTGWAGLTDIAWPDLPFTPPSNRTWVRFNCVENDGYQASIGSPTSNRFRHFGIITIQVFQPQGQATIDVNKKADAALAVFMGKETNGIHFYDVQAKQIGNDGHGFYQINVYASFRYDQLT